MYQIKKSDTPDHLAGDKASNAKEAIKAIVDSGTNPVSSDFDNDIYGHKDVKNKLKKCHNNRCAYCGCSLQGDFAPVEHYRPKTGYKIARNSVLIKPGYHWLAYEWDNLLCSCDECNSAEFKGNLFPLIDETKRSITDEDISKETPVLINPSIDNPSDFFEYDTWIMRPKSGISLINERRARGTIDILCLNGERIENGKTTMPRASLINERKTSWDIFCQIVDFIKTKKPELSLDEARQFVVSKLGLNQLSFGFMFEKWQ